MQGYYKCVLLWKFHGPHPNHTFNKTFIDSQLLNISRIYFKFTSLICFLPYIQNKPVTPACNYTYLNMHT